MKTLIKFEELAKLIGAFSMSLYLGFEWWLYVLLFFLPDLSMLGYLLGPKPGAILYNLFHHYSTGIFIALAGTFLHEDKLLLCGLVLIGHAAFDRILGYGLKYLTGFKFTHLGIINKPLEGDMN